jgi:hypothetical protein
VDEIEQAANEHRFEIAMRNRRRSLDTRERKLTMAVFGLMGYSAFGNFVGAAMAYGALPADAWLGVVLGVLYSFGAYRVWVKDDTRWWPVAVPAGITIVVLLLAWFGGLHRPIPVILNIVLLTLVPLRARACRAIAAVPNNSFKPKPLRGSA